MYETDGALVVSATDLVKHLACAHITQLDRELTRGERTLPDRDDALLSILFERGIGHEAAYLERLRADGKEIVEIATQDGSMRGLRRAEDATLAAIDAGADVIYQATFFDGTWRGHADFLLRRPDRPGRLPWSYDVADTKLSHRLTVAALLQMAVYADRLTALQGVEPERLLVVTGDGRERPFRFRDCAAYTRLVRRTYLDVLGRAEPTLAEPVAYCAQCRWRRTCRAAWRATDDLSLVAFMRRDQARALREAGVSTVRDLAMAHPDELPARIGEPSRHRLTHQARLQVRERDERSPLYEVLAPEPQRGLCVLPAPSPGDVFFDIEGDPFAAEQGLEYLWGLLDAEGFHPIWAHDAAEEKAALETVVDHLMTAWRRDPGMHVYHYASYEPTRLMTLTARYGTRQDELDSLLRGGRLVDLYAVVRQGLRVSKESYSIKELEHFYRGERRGHDGVSDALGSVVAYERWLGVADGERDQTLLSDIEAYNADDCRSTLELRDWLETVRAEAGGDDVFGRPVDGDGAPTEAALAVSAEVADLQRALRSLAEGTDDAPDVGAYRLLADLIDWHRREARPEWWDYFRRQRMDDDELVDDTAAVGRLSDAAAIGTVKQSTLWEMSFPPQETKLGPSEARWVDPRTGRGVGTVTEIDPEEGRLVLKRGTRAGPPGFTAIAPGQPIEDRHQRARLRELARWVIDHGIDDPGVQWRAARQLLLRCSAPPAPGDRSLKRDGEDAQAALERLALTLGPGVLPVQGPPGTGKTYAGAHTILHLVRAGRTVGICAFSHKAITNLLDEVSAMADAAGQEVRLIQRASAEQGSHRHDVTVTDTPREVEDAVARGAVDVVAGTAWLFSREAMQGAVDVLVVDEAGQMSLANVLAVTGATQGLVLLGDPQQLTQPVKGVHPPGSGLSVLEHLLGDERTIRPERGLLLDVTRRMHPDITAFVSDQSYDGRLASHPDCGRRAVVSAGALGGTGLRYIPVEHRDNSAASSEEAEVVARLVADVLADGRWVTRSASRRLGPSDVLVLAPYNAHVHRLRSRLASVSPEVRVGTVDKFQGQEAPIVVYSMASSSSEDAPRGIGFLYDAHRFNVAISRAQAVVAVVCSPRLLVPSVSRPEHLALVNALVSFATSAS